MAMATVLSRAQHGMDAPQVRVEVDISNGLPAFAIVGLPEAVVKESKDRVRAAITNCNFVMPNGPHHRQSLARRSAEGRRTFRSADRGRHPARFRAVAGRNLERCELYGELSLSGELRPVKGALLAAVAAARAEHIDDRATGECRRGRTRDAMSGGGSRRICWKSLRTSTQSRPLNSSAAARSPSRSATVHSDLNEVRGQALASRALEIAAAGHTACCSSARPARARACSHNGCRACCRR